MKPILFSLLILSCSSKVPKYIQGHICNSEKKPLTGIKVQDPNDRKIFAITNNDGYFKINQLTNGKLLYVFENEKKIDSIYIITTHPERGISYNFVEGEKDTLFIDLKNRF
ncbi:hypothetical protein [Flavobacterium sp.]|uniref:hypothetical protein n=1 Tax=Flavobacterium sp. TaxID=239 RepID=UPI00404731FC